MAASLIGHVSHPYRAMGILLASATASFAAYGAFFLIDLFAQAAAFRSLAESVVQNFAVREKLMWAPVSLQFDQTSIVEFTRRQMCCLSKFLAVPFVEIVADFFGASLAPIASKWKCVLSNA